jgi:hypothetical protein
MNTPRGEEGSRTFESKMSPFDDDDDDDDDDNEDVCCSPASSSCLLLLLLLLLLFIGIKIINEADTTLAFGGPSYSFLFLFVQKRKTREFYVNSHTFCVKIKYLSSKKNNGRRTIV